MFPLDTADPSPIVFLDLAGGIASDAELRRIPMTRLDLEPFVELASHSAVIVRVGSDAPPCAFLFRRGTL